VELIRDTFGRISIYPIERRFFNDKQGYEDIARFCSSKSSSVLPFIAQKYYCLSAVSALLTYLKEKNCISFADKCLKVEYQNKQGGMMIDNETASRLELLYSLSNEKSSKKFSLFSVLNKCETSIGQRHLRANILEPSCNLECIRNRQEQIKVLIESEHLVLSLKECLQRFRSVDRLLKISCITPANDIEKAIETNIQLALMLKQCLEAVNPLHEIIQNSVSEPIRALLAAPIFSDIINEINKVLQPDIHMNRLAQKHFLNLYAVKSGFNESIDYLRKFYSDQTDEIRKYSENLIEKVALPMKLIYSLKLGYHFQFKTPDPSLPFPVELNVIHRKGSNVYLNTPEMLCLNNTTKTLAFDIIKISNSIICDLLIRIAKEIDVIHHLISVIIDLDIVQSLAEVSSKKSFSCPSFGKITRIENAFHPMLEISKNGGNVIDNNIVSGVQISYYFVLQLSFNLNFHRLQLLSTTFSSSAAQI
jgi:DNA mismatch repair protein MSH4